MKQKFNAFLLKIAILTASILVIAYFLFTELLSAYYLPVFPWLLAFFVTVTSLVHFFHLKSQESVGAKFARFAIAINGIKIGLYLIFILAYVFLKRDTAVPFLFGFFVLYLIFNLFEVVIYQMVLRKDLKDKSSGPQKQE